MTEMSVVASIFPPERTIATGPAPPARPASSAASPTAPAPSTRSFSRSRRARARPIFPRPRPPRCRPGPVEDHAGELAARLHRDPVGDREPRPADDADNPLAGTRSRSAREIPEANPPPPTGMRTVSASGACSAARARSCLVRRRRGGPRRRGRASRQSCRHAVAQRRLPPRSLAELLDRAAVGRAASTFAIGASSGMKIVAAIPASRAAQATAWPWLPALAATTPARRSPAESVAIVLYAPRILNEPVR